MVGRDDVFSVPKLGLFGPQNHRVAMIQMFNFSVSLGLLSNPRSHLRAILYLRN